MSLTFNALSRSIIRQFNMKNGFKVVPFILGQPGGGKSACVRAIAKEIQKLRDIPDERVIEFNPSLRDPVDIMGVPNTDGEYAKWCPPEEFWAIRKGQGPSILILEELSDATMAMQNPLCRVILDRHAGQLPLSEELYILATGNRTEDKSGANRLSTKLANRTRMYEFETSAEEWCSWARKNEINPVTVAFINFRPGLLSDFDPKRLQNPTPRSWEDVSRIPEDLSPAEYFDSVAGSVGEGAAAEYTAFVRIAGELPDVDDFLKNPASCKTDNPAVLYALIGKMVDGVNKKNFPKYWAWFKTLSPEFCIMAVKACVDRNNTVYSCMDVMKEFVAMYSDVLSGSEK